MLLIVTQILLISPFKKYMENSMEYKEDKFLKKLSGAVLVRDYNRTI